MIDQDPFVLKVGWRESIKMIFFGVLLITLTIAGLIWLFYPFFSAEDTWDMLVNSILFLVIVLTGVPFLVYLISVLSFGLVSTGFYNIVRLKKYDGLIYRLDEDGLAYFENNKYHLKKWNEISDVGSFKQEDTENKVLYKYEIKFTDGTTHEFDLRGKYPTKEFKGVIERYWLFYNH
ncbi:hypothetical protein [Candidatus Enterococcus mangumiae]|uniref:YcxB-like protein domain-containing protein n=1 Tax=Candidatus Enterococcus mangumiae TaxID=2230878 RepID=A0ABZ2T0C2_9ENTE|nr:hypothetical protein [Enterococcus sp. DIV1094]MBO0490468.1 hypothetical protein [Enterococcus sp. DIV1094]